MPANQANDDKREQAINTLPKLHESNSPEEVLCCLESAIEAFDHAGRIASDNYRNFAAGKPWLMISSELESVRKRIEVRLNKRCTMEEKVPA
ncbi:MAG: hypothetical protein WDO70_12130 [Alphaproteobacteria bacterium]